MSDDFTGKTLGQYEVIEEVGRGGMATVYRARQSSINRTVAVKVLPRNLLHDPDFYERFEREVDVIAHLEHPHILPIYDYGKAEGVPFIVMRYLAGGSLQETIRKGTVPLDQIEKPITQVASALDHAHQHGIIHRDLKPANILLDDAGNAYLTDFGIARVLGSDLTGSMLIGTPAYMSPEQASGLPLDARSDIYALGVVLFEMITGREPYQAETPVALLFKHINESIPPVANYRQGVPASVEAVIMRATAKQPDDRYASAGDLALALREALLAPTAPAIEVTNGIHEDATAIIPDAQTPTPLPQTPAHVTPAPQRASMVDVAGEQQAPVEPASRSGISPVMLAVGALLVLVIGGGALALALPGILPAEVLPTPNYASMFATEAASTPTPFAGSERVTGEDFSISIPAAPQWTSAGEETADGRTLTSWHNTENTGRVSIALVETEIDSEASFGQAVAEYDQRFYASDSRLNLIDETTAPDGTIRRSYRLHDPQSNPVASGQIDVFYLRDDSDLAVLEVYSADSIGNALVPTFQSILDSVRIDS